MSIASVTPEASHLRAHLDAKMAQLRVLFEKYRATNPVLFGSVARGDATEQSDIDIMVSMDSADGNILMRASGLLEEARELLGENVDIFPRQLLKRPISESALQEAIVL